MPCMNTHESNLLFRQATLALLHPRVPQRRVCCNGGLFNLGLACEQIRTRAWTTNIGSCGAGKQATISPLRVQFKAA